MATAGKSRTISCECVPLCASEETKRKNTITIPKIECLWLAFEYCNEIQCRSKD